MMGQDLHPVYRRVSHDAVQVAATCGWWAWPEDDYRLDRRPDPSEAQCEGGEPISDFWPGQGVAGMPWHLWEHPMSSVCPAE